MSTAEGGGMDSMPTRAHDDDARFYVDEEMGESVGLVGRSGWTGGQASLIDRSTCHGLVIELGEWGPVTGTRECCGFNEW